MSAFSSLYPYANFTLTMPAAIPPARPFPADAKKAGPRGPAFVSD